MKNLLALGIVLLLAACTSPAITSFDECVAAGNPVMESYPRQCAANGQTFVEEIEEPINPPAQDFTACESLRPEACTLQYDPVCAFNGTDAFTAGNDCTACADPQVQGHYPGACEDNRFVLCDAESVTGFNFTQMAAENGWICIESCPSNYDPYITQIGAQMCIAHYGQEQISSWETCERSSDTCECVKAYETTQEEPIDDPEFRCVPEQYAERLLFRAGQERLDENGQGSVMIA